ncbi:hypothetical protein ABK046_48685, partial [Streptomyces caeruleatus]
TMRDAYMFFLKFLLTMRTNHLAHYVQVSHTPVVEEFVNYFNAVPIDIRQELSAQQAAIKAASNETAK